MAKLDRLGWAAGIGFMSHGLRVGIRVNNPAVLERIPEHLPPTSDPVTSPIVDVLYSLILGGDSTNSRVRRFHLLYIGAGQLARTMKLAELFDTLESDLHL